MFGCPTWYLPVVDMIGFPKQLIQKNNISNLYKRRAEGKTVKDVF
jgi:hypothetical protein